MDCTAEFPHAAEMIGKAIAKIAKELRRQYWLSYYSTNPKDDGSYRKIRVGVNQSDGKKWAVRAKNGRRAPKK